MVLLFDRTEAAGPTLPESRGHSKRNRASFSALETSRAVHYPELNKTGQTAVSPMFFYCPFASPPRGIALPEKTLNNGQLASIHSHSAALLLCSSSAQLPALAATCLSSPPFHLHLNKSTHQLVSVSPHHLPSVPKCRR